MLIHTRTYAYTYSCVHTCIHTYSYTYNHTYMHRFNLHAPQMSESFRSRIAHCLHREQRLHIPTIIRLFHNTVLDAKCMRANVNMREYIGHCRDLQGHWLKNYFYCCISGLMVGQGEKLNNGDYSEQDTIRRAITVINKIRPRFLIVSGNFTGKGDV